MKIKMLIIGLSMLISIFGAAALGVFNGKVDSEPLKVVEVATENIKQEENKQEENKETNNTNEENKEGQPIVQESNKENFVPIVTNNTNNNKVENTNNNNNNENSNNNNANTNNVTETKPATNNNNSNNNNVARPAENKPAVSRPVEQPKPEHKPAPVAPKPVETPKPVVAPKPSPTPAPAPAPRTISETSYDTAYNRAISGLRNRQNTVKLGDYNSQSAANAIGDRVFANYKKKVLERDPSRDITKKGLYGYKYYVYSRYYVRNTGNGVWQLYMEGIYSAETVMKNPSL